MQSNAIPTKFPIPFANSAGAGYINNIPVNSQIGITPGAASLTDGFPPLNFLPVGAGGVPPLGPDFNGILNQVTAWLQWVNAGGQVVYDSGFSASIGGYPLGAILASATTPGVLWLSTVENNTANPDTGGAGWVNISTSIISSNTLWVRTDGNDNNNGSANNAANAFATIQGALNAAANKFTLTGRTVNILLGNSGTYAGFIVTNLPSVSVTGDPANIANYVITSAANGNPISVQGSTLTLSGVKINNTNAGTYSLQAAYGGNILASNIIFAGVASTASDVKTFPGGSITMSTSITFSRNAANAIRAQGGSVVTTVGTTLTFSGTPAYSSATVYATDIGLVYFTGTTMTGSATGVRYNANTNSVIDTSSGGASYIPGNSAGVTSAGGQYV